jgi:hypothetical protein
MNELAKKSAAPEIVQIKPDLSSTANPSITPLKWSGMLVNTGLGENGDISVRCTAQFISPKVILTAAHCIQSTASGEFYDISRMFFLLQYQNGEYSKLYRPVCLSRFDGFMPSAGSLLDPLERYQWDYAMILLDGENQTGHFNLEVEWRGKYEKAMMTGYPAEVLDGEIIQIAAGPLGTTTDLQNIVSLDHKDHPNMTRGTSGGAYVANFSRNEGAGWNLAISVSSFFRTAHPEISYGPYFTSAAKQLFEYVSSGCPKQ